jgi:hypothetical protein
MQDTVVNHKGRATFCGFFPSSSHDRPTISSKTHKTYKKKLDIPLAPGV